MERAQRQTATNVSLQDFKCYLYNSSNYKKCTPAFIYVFFHSLLEPSWRRGHPLTYSCTVVYSHLHMTANSREVLNVLKSGASQKRRPVHLAGGKFQLELSGTNRRFKEKSSAHFWWQAIPTTVARGSTVSPHPVKDRKTKSTTGAASGEHTGSGMLTMSSFYHGHPRDYKVLVGGQQCCHVHPLSLS